MIQSPERYRHLYWEDIQVQAVHHLDKALVGRHPVPGMLLLVEGTLQGGTVLVACVPEGAGTCLVPREDKLRVGDCRMDMIQADNVLLLQRVSVHVCVPKIQIPLLTYQSHSQYMRINSSTIRVSRRVEAKNATGKYANILIFIQHGTETVQVTPVRRTLAYSP